VQERMAMKVSALQRSDGRVGKMAIMVPSGFCSAFLVGEHADVPCSSMPETHGSETATILASGTLPPLSCKQGRASVAETG
jgi:hypothetical protein